MFVNPHSGLLLDVHTRLLRTSGASFQYISGRAQVDEQLPWVGIGRHEREFREDWHAFRKSLRPMSPTPTASSQHPSVRASA